MKPSTKGIPVGSHLRIRKGPKGIECDVLPPKVKATLNDRQLAARLAEAIRLTLIHVHEPGCEPFRRFGRDAKCQCHQKRLDAAFTLYTDHHPEGLF